MKISRALNLVVPLDTERGPAFVHAEPIAREVFEAYYLVMGKAFARVYSEGLGAMAGPRVAYLMLKDVAKEAGVWEGSGGVEAGLVGEIIRRANLTMPKSTGGWEQLGLADAISRRLIDEDDYGEVVGQLVFFTLEVRLHRKEQAAEMLALANGLWGSRTTPLPFTDFMNSLPISTPDASSGSPASDQTEPAPAATSFPLR